MRSAIIAGLIYFALVFAAGFAFGVLRVLMLESQFGRLAGTLIELPFILAISWLLAVRLIRTFEVPTRIPARLLMGALALGLLLVAEALLSVFGMGRSLNEHLATYRTAGPQLGLVAQIVFGLFPLLHLFLRSRPERA